MTWTPENNTTIWALLTNEQKDALKAAKHGWFWYISSLGEWDYIDEPSWTAEYVYRAKPAPKWEPPAELWALLRDDIVAIARDENSVGIGGWMGASEIPIFSGATWSMGGIYYDLEALNLPDIPAEESLFLRPVRV